MYKKLSTLWAGLMFVSIALLLPLYIPLRGYSYMGTDKFRFFLCGMTPFTICGFLLFIYSAIKKKIAKLSILDWFALLFGIACILSFLFSAHKDIALIGNDEWNMGLVSQLLFVLIYFGISRYISRIKQCIYAVCIVGVPMALLTIVNRFGFYPLPIHGKHPLYVSTIGNINWFCGFFIMITAMELVLFFYSKSRKEKCLFGSALFLSLLAMICQGSMSGYMALLVLLILLLKPALKNRQSFLTYLEIYMLLFSGCTLTYITGYFSLGTYAENDPIVNLVAFSVLPCICLFIVILLYIILCFTDKEFDISFIYKYIVGSILTLFMGYLLLCLINTLLPHITPALNGISFFTFDRFWWSTRGGTYAIGVQAFVSLPWWRMLLGIGPDCFLTYVYDNLDKVTVAKCFKLQPLANAHNEFLTMLVNTGLFGFTCYAGIFASAIKNAVKYTNPFIKVILFGILGYMINNLFSFQQVISTSFVFVLLGILENLLRKERSHASN